MTFPSLLAAGLLTLAPAIGDAQADRIGSAIHDATGPDVDAASAMLVTIVRESGGRDDAGRCAIDGIEGLGFYGLGPRWGRRVACASLERQSRTAFRALSSYGWPELGDGVFAHYLGADDDHHEARERRALFVLTRARLSLAACL